MLMKHLILGIGMSTILRHRLTPTCIDWKTSSTILIVLSKLLRVLGMQDHVAPMLAAVAVGLVHVAVVAAETISMPWNCRFVTVHKVSALTLVGWKSDDQGAELRVQL